MSSGKRSKDQKNAELDWFSFETRVRKLIQDLVEPVSKRAVEAKESSDTLRKSNDNLKRKVEEIEFVVHKSQKKSTIFEDINNKFTKMDVGLQSLEQQLDQDISA